MAYTASIYNTNYKNEEKQSIGVEEVRETLSHVSLLPPLNENQCLYIRDMDILTPEAMNALLKTIEEPPSRTFILLASANADAILPTIRSRCQTILLKSEKLALTTEEEKEYQKTLQYLQPVIYAKTHAFKEISQAR